MKKDRRRLSTERLQRISAQGYTMQTDSELSDLAAGNRFAYQLCTAVLIVGITTTNLPLLLAMDVIAILGVLMPNHPFDYIYNGLIRKILSKPALPARSAQLQFSCSVATAWITLTLLLLNASMMITGYLMGAMLIGVAILVSTIDLCIPSLMYNRIFGYRLQTQK